MPIKIAMIGAGSIGFTWLRPAIMLYPVLARMGLRPFMRQALIPPQYIAAVQNLDADPQH